MENLTPVITIKNLNKVYDSTLILKDINLNFYAGQITGYIGPNGAGKSTTLKILIGMLGDFTGQVSVLGFDVKTNSMEVKKRIGYVPENAILYEVLTPMEYLLFIGRLYQLEDAVIEKRATELLTILGLKEVINSRMNTFSKGMRQKVLLISGLIHNPEIIFLDEPLSGLDANAVILVKEILSKLKEAGKTIIYSSHIMDVVEKLSDRIIILNKGEVVADGTFAELKNNATSGSLEGIFSNLTGNSQEDQTLSNEFISALS
ncbi:MAG: ABC transporter ATP-binding protein [Arcicella sp.]|nr:ABC transporter ATP-binding protein [Arcicella sp.]